MLIVWLTFIGISTSILAAYWIGVVVPENREHAQLKQRLKGEAAGKAGKTRSLLKETLPLSRIPLLDALLRRSGGPTARLQAMIEDSGLPLNPGRFVLLSLMAGSVAVLVVYSYTHLWWPTLGAMVGTSLLPLAVVRFFVVRRVRKFEEQFPEAIDLIARAMRAGHAFPTGLKIAAEELPLPAGVKFRKLYEQQNYGAHLGEALRAFADSVRSLDARFFVTAVLTQRETGGNLAEVLDRLAAVMRERFRIRRDVRAKSAHGRMTAYVLGGMPIALAGFLMLTNPSQFSLLLHDPLGHQMLAAGFTLELVGVFIIRKLVNIEY
jgi:tight adherence protein B